jgi:hypothetical protein
MYDFFHISNPLLKLYSKYNHMSKIVGIAIIVLILAFTVGFQLGSSYSDIIDNSETRITAASLSNCPDDTTPYSQCDSCCSFPSPPASGCIEITNFHYNAAGNDHDNLNDEYVTFRNQCQYPIDMTSWTVRDERVSHIYTIPRFVLHARASFTLYTGSGRDTSSRLYWGHNQAIWNNDGDTLFLRDDSGRAILEYGY